MNINDQQIDHLFSQARKEQPKVSFEETKNAFVTASIAATGGVLATKGLLQLITTKKFIIMFSLLSIITAASIVIGLPNEPIENPDNQEIVLPVAIEEAEQETPSEITHQEIPVDAIGNETFKGLTYTSNSILDRAEESAAVNDTTKVLKQEEEEDKESKIATSKEKIQSYDERFRITENTTENELKDIKEKAIADGISFDYKAHFKESKLKSIKINMDYKLVKENRNSDVKIDMQMDEEFDYYIAWKRNDNGQVEDLYFDETPATVKRNNDIDLMLERLEAKLDSVDMEIDINLDSTLNAIRIKIDAIDFEQEIKEISLETRELTHVIEMELGHLKQKLAIKTAEIGKKREVIGEELYKDGIIKAKDDKFRIKMTDDVVKVNGKKLPADLQPKYREIMEDYYEVIEDWDIDE